MLFFNMMSLSYLISFRPFFTKRHKIIITSKFKAKKMKEKFELLSQRSSPKTNESFSFRVFFNFIFLHNRVHHPKRPIDQGARMASFSIIGHQTSNLE
jgi:hypothetical protein